MSKNINDKTTKDGRQNNRQMDIIENYTLPEGDEEGRVKPNIPDNLTLYNNSIAHAVVSKINEFKVSSHIVPYVSIETKIKLKYDVAELMSELLVNPRELKSALVNITLAENDLVIYALALNQLTGKAEPKRCDFDYDNLMRLTTFLNLVILYDYKIREVPIPDHRPTRDAFKSFLFKGGLSKSSAETVAGMVY